MQKEKKEKKGNKHSNEKFNGSNVTRIGKRGKSRQGMTRGYKRKK